MLTTEIVANIIGSRDIAAGSLASVATQGHEARKKAHTAARTYAHLRATTLARHTRPLS